MNSSWIPEDWALPESISSRLGQTVGRQRAMVEEGDLLLILHAPPELGQDERVARVFWCDSIGVWKSNLGQGATALNHHLQEFQNLIEKLEDEEAKATSAQDYFAVLERATPLHRCIRNLHHALQQARDLYPENSDIISLRDSGYATERQAELLLTDTKNSLEFYVAQKTEEMTRTGHQMAVASHRLNTLAAMFLPTATLAGVLGMNLPSGFEKWGQPYLFYFTIVLGIAMGVSVKSWLERSTE